MPITTSKTYRHNLSKKQFPTKKEALEDYDKELQKRRKKDSQQSILETVRLESSNLEEIQKNAALAIKKLLDVDVETNISGRFRFDLSNTHSAPIGKPTNWKQTPDLPTSYPGFDCSIKLNFKNVEDSNKVMSLSNPEYLKMMGIHTGSGGSGNGLHYSYHCYIFVDDFPKIQNQFKDYLEYAKNHDQEQEDRAVKWEEHNKKIKELYSEEQVVQNNLAEIDKINKQTEQLIAARNLCLKTNEQVDSRLRIDNPFKFEEKYPRAGLNPLFC